MRRNKLDVTLFLVALTLGGHLVATQGGPTTAELSGRQNNLLSTFLPHELLEIRLRPQTPTAEVVLRKDITGGDDARFFLGSAGSRVADLEAVTELLSVLEFASWKRVLKADDDATPAYFGFESPALEVNISAGPRSYRVMIGNPAPTPSESRYARVEGVNIQTVTGVVDQSLLSKLHRQEQEFRGGMLFPYARRDTSRLTIKTKHETLVLTADALGFRLLSNPPGSSVRAARLTTDLLFFQLARARLESFLSAPPVTPPPGSESESASAVTIIQESADGPAHEVTLGARCPGTDLTIFAQKSRPDAVAGCVSRSIFAGLLVDRQQLTDQTISPLLQDEIDHVTVTYGERVVDLLRDNVDFRLLNRKSEFVAKASGDEFLKALTETRLVHLPTSPPGPKMLGTILLRGQSPATAVHPHQVPTPGAGEPSTDALQEVHLDLYESADESKSVLLQRKDDGAWLKVPEASRWAFSGDDAWARKRELLAVPSSQILQVKIKLPTGEVQEIRHGDAGYELVSSARARADAALSRNLTEELAQLTAQRFVTPSRPRPSTGLIEVEFQYQVTPQSAAESATLWLGSRTSGGYLAWSSLTEGTFVLPLRVRTTLESPLVDCSPLRIEPSDLLTLEITTRETKYSFVREGEQLTAYGHDARLDMIEPLSIALRELRVLSGTSGHPLRKTVTRGRPTLTLKGTRRGLDGAPEPFVLCVGEPSVWQGLSAQTAWLEGSQETYFVSTASLASLLSIL